MAKTSAIQKNIRRQATTERLRAKREALLKVMRDPNLEFEERDAAQRKLRKLPRDSSRTRIKNRCLLTGRPRAFSSTHIHR